MAVYLTGTLAIRRNLPTVSLSRPVWDEVVVPQGLLRPGTNTIAAEVHQRTLINEDMASPAVAEAPVAEWEQLARGVAPPERAERAGLVFRPATERQPGRPGAAAVCRPDRENEIELAWPAAYGAWSVQSSTTMQSLSCQALPGLVLRGAGWHYLRHPLDTPARFFRLHQP